MVFLLLASIFGPQLLAAARLSQRLPQEVMEKTHSRIMWTLMIFLGAPFLCFYKKLRMKYLEMKCIAFPNDASNEQEWEKMKRELNNHIKLELGLETIYQLAGQLILLGLAWSETNTNEGLRTLFAEAMDNDELNKSDVTKQILDYFGIQRSTFTISLLILSIVLSFFSCIRSHLKALSASRERFPMSSKMAAVTYSLFSCTMRVLAIVVYFAVPLGLFNLLRHLQAEQVQWSPSTVANFIGPDSDANLPFFVYVTWSDIDRWTKNQTFEPFIFSQQWDNGIAKWNPGYLISPPDYTIYTGLSLIEYFGLFIVNLILHSLCVFVTKHGLSVHFRNGLNFLEKVIHCLENTNIPYNSQEWDDAKGNAKEHKKRMEANLKEIKAVIVIKAIFNLSLLTPMIFLGKNFEY